MTTTEERPETEQPVDVTKIIRAAKTFIQSLYQSEPIYNLLLEEVERGSDGFWYITFGFDRPSNNPKDTINTLSDLALYGRPKLSDDRVFKRITVDNSGTPLAMNIRNP